VYGRTALDHAAAYDHKESAERLYKYGGTMHFASACRLKKYDDAKRLLAQGKLPKAIGDNDNVTPLYLACQQGAAPIVEYLLQRGEKVIADQYDSPLHIAAREGHAEVVETLLKHGVKVDLQVKGHGTPLARACSFGQAEVVAVLIKAGADVNARTDGGYTPLHGVGWHRQIIADDPAVRKRVVACARFLHAAGADLRARDAAGRLPLHDAASCGHVELVAFFLDHSIDVNVRDYADHTPLWYASRDTFFKQDTTAAAALLRQRGGKAE
jgi:ankyrin repeat protein